MDRRISFDIRKCTSSTKAGNSYTLTSNHAEEVLRDMLRVKRKRIWSKRFVVLEESSLYYFKSPASVTPRFFIKLEGIEVVQLGFSENQFVLQITQASQKLKLGFVSEMVYKKWFEELRARSIESSSESRNRFLSEVTFKKRKHVPKIQPVLAEKVKNTVHKEYTLVGSLGHCNLYLENPDILLTKERDSIEHYYYIFILYAFLSFINPQAASTLLLIFFVGFLFVKKKTNPTETCGFKCEMLIDRTADELLETLKDYSNRNKWDPYVETATENTLKYRSGSQGLFQHIAMDNSTYLVIEKAADVTKNIFSIREEEEVSVICHYGTYSKPNNPMIGHPDLLNCLKHFILLSQSTGLLESRCESEDLSLDLEIKQNKSKASWDHEIYEILKEVLQLNAKHDWETFSTSGVTAFKRKSPGGLQTVKGDTVVEKPINVVLNFITDIKNRGKYEEMLESGSLVEKTDDFSQVFHIKLKKMNGMISRDFCIAQKQFELSGGRFAVLSMSIDHPMCPETDAIRGHLHFGCFLVEALNSGKTKITYLVQIDLKGNVPKWILSSLQEKQVNILERIRSSMV